MAAKSQDKIIFGVAVALLLGSAGWMALQGSKLAALRASAEGSSNSNAYVATGTDAPSLTKSSWATPPSQSGGSEWVYDVFTPPEIYYDADTKRFTVTPPTGPVIEAPKPPPPFGVELVGVRQDVFRLQLVGYIGDIANPASQRGNFENAITGETIIGRSGQDVPALDLTIKSFEVKRHEIVSKDSQKVYDIEAIAIVVDKKTGEQTTLTNKKRHINGTPFALLKVDGEAEPKPYKADATFSANGANYTVVSVTAEPPSAAVRKEGADLKEPTTKTLTPAAPAAPSTTPATPAPAADSPAPVTFPFGN